MSALVTAPIALTVTLGSGAFRACFATTDPGVAVKIGHGNAEEFAVWERLTNGGETNVCNGVRIPRMELLVPELWSWHTEFDRDSYSAACFGNGRDGAAVLAVERVPGGRRLCDVECHCRPCTGRSVCADGCVREASRTAYPTVRDQHDDNLMIDRNGGTWLVDIAL
jgi:hypothetical protein